MNFLNKKKTKFKKNERVKRLIDHFEPSKGYIFGKIIRVYSFKAKKQYYEDSVDYPELYDVKFDNGEIHCCYLPEGLEKE